jgi:beta-glucosidase
MSLSFPPGFLWGAATSSAQIEGAWNADGKGPSIWDAFCREKGRVSGGDTADAACDSYHRFGEDVALLKDLGADVYRFSIAWPRIFPTGRGPVNQAGLKYYHRLVDALLAAGIQPFCTLYHWDLPQALQDEGGWENRATIDAFVDYAELIFREFHGKIGKWLTLNEPWCSAFLGNFIGIHAPGKKDLKAALAVAHHHLVAHGLTVNRFRSLVASGHASGTIGIAPNISWVDPYTDSEADRQAALRGIQWSWDWFLDPICFGEYPEPLAGWFADKGFRPPVLAGDMDAIRQPIDFVGGNYYFATAARFDPSPEGGLLASTPVDLGLEKSDMGWPLTPEGFTKSVVRIHQRYGLPFYVTENGLGLNDPQDQRRIVYLDQHLRALRRAMAQGADVRGYMAWSLLDNFEWAEGYSKRFGLVHVDFATGARTPKPSFGWYKQLIGREKAGAEL